VRPRGSVLARRVDVGLRDMRGQPQTIMLVTSGFPELFWSQHFSQSAGRIRGIIDRNVGDVVTAKLAQQMGQQTSRVRRKKSFHFNLLDQPIGRYGRPTGGGS
jgi:hypothetical protein